MLNLIPDLISAIKMRLSSRGCIRLRAHASNRLFRKMDGRNYGSVPECGPNKKRNCIIRFWFYCAPSHTRTQSTAIPMKLINRISFMSQWVQFTETNKKQTKFSLIFFLIVIYLVRLCSDIISHFPFEYTNIDLYFYHVVLYSCHETKLSHRWNADTRPIT